MYNSRTRHRRSRTSVRCLETHLLIQTILTDILQDAIFVTLQPAPTIATSDIPNSLSLNEGRFVSHFRSNVANLISFSVSDSSNPFFSHVLPQVSRSRLVRAAVEAVAAAHLHVLGATSSHCAATLQLKALRQLSIDVRRRDLSDDLREQVVTASLLLIYYEVCYNAFIIDPSRVTEQCSRSS